MKRRSTMKIITAAELASKTGFELSALYARIREELGRTEPGSYDHEILSVSLDNIRRAFASRRTSGPKF
jgi:hypothetical protein